MRVEREGAEKKKNISNVPKCPKVAKPILRAKSVRKIPSRINRKKRISHLGEIHNKML